MKKIFTILLFSILLFAELPAQAVNDLYVHIPGRGGTRNIFIDHGILIIEPHAGYTEHSLYFTYNSRNNYNGWNTLEIVHNFTLPERTAIDDMWLWMDGGIMQAVMMDVHTASAIYDSIVVPLQPVDPAIVRKYGKQYELRMYPYVGGADQKLKLRCIAPAVSDSGVQYAELPLRFFTEGLQPNSTMDVIFKVRLGDWGEPFIKEFPDREFTFLREEYGYRYYQWDAPAEFWNHAPLHIAYRTTFEDGIYAANSKAHNGRTAMQIGVEPSSAFSEVSPQRSVVVGIDLSSPIVGPVSNELSEIQESVRSILRPQDEARYVFTGADSLSQYIASWYEGSDEAIAEVFRNFLKSTHATRINKNKHKFIVYADATAFNNWSYGGLANEAGYAFTSDLEEAVEMIEQADVIASFTHGAQQHFSSSELQQVLAAFDDFFARGGRMVTYFDDRRNENEQIASHYIAGLSGSSVSSAEAALTPATGGNIASGFPSEITRASNAVINFGDGEARVELENTAGEPVVISKRIGDGLLIVSGMNQTQDPEEILDLTSPVLLGITEVTYYSQLNSMLENIKSLNNAEEYDVALIYSNDDFLFSESQARIYYNQYQQTANNPLPAFYSINLLDGYVYQADELTVDGLTYYGSGWLMQHFANNTGGAHYELARMDYDVASTLLYDKFVDEDFTDITLSLTPGSGGSIEHLFQLEAEDTVTEQTFFFGEVVNSQSVKVNIGGRSVATNDLVAIQKEIVLTNDSTLTDPVVAKAGANERMQWIYEEAIYDTLHLINLSMQHNLLCDYTALIALEPNDTLHYMLNPEDESDLTSIDEEEEIEMVDSLALDVFPNPFNSQTTIALSLPNRSDMTVRVYNILGQEVYKIAAEQGVLGRHRYRWHGFDASNRTAATGIYFIVAHVTDTASGKQKTLSTKVMLLK